MDAHPISNPVIGGGSGDVPKRTDVQHAAFWQAGTALLGDAPVGSLFVAAVLAQQFRYFPPGAARDRGVKFSHWTLAFACLAGSTSVPPLWSKAAAR